MKAVIYSKYGPPEVLKLAEKPKPNPKKNEVLIKVHATTVTIADTRIRSANPFLVRMINGLFKPVFIKNLGIELSGKIESIGCGVRDFKIGDEVFASAGIRMGSYVQYKCISANGMIAKKPESISYQEAAALPVGGITALYYLIDKGDIQPGQRVLIYGSSGSVGTYAVQIAKYYGTEVTAVCSTNNLELVKSIGADHTIDYTQGDFTNSANKFDIILDAVGKTSAKTCQKILSASGKFLSVDKGMARGGRKKLGILKELVESGNVTPVIDRSYPLQNIVEAHAYVDQGHKKGNVVINMDIEG